MANEVTIIVRAKNETKAAFAAARKDAEKLGTDMGTVINKKITESITNTTNTSRSSTDDLGTKLGDSIGRKIRERISENVKVAFERIRIDREKIDVDVNEKENGAKSGGTSRQRVKVDVDVDESSKRNFLQRFTDMAKSSGERMKEALTTGITGVFSGDVISTGIKGISIAILAAVTAPIIGSAFVGVLLLALGGGVLAAGITSAFKNPIITTQATALKNKLSKMFEEFGKPFVGPLGIFLEKFSAFLGSAAPQFQAIADAFAPVLMQLGTGFIGLLQNAMPGIVDAIIAAAPFFEMLAAHAPAIGQMMGDFFRTISEHGEEATQFFSDLLTVIEWIIPKVAELMGAFADGYRKIRSLAKAIATFFGYVSSLVGFWVSVIKQAWKKITTAASSAFSSAYGKVAAIMGAIAANVGGAITTIGGYISRIKGWINSLQSKTITISIRQIISTVGNLIGSVLGNAHGGVVGAATGGIHSGMRLVGEAGPELVQLPPGSRVHPTGATQRMMGGGQRGAGDSQVTFAFKRGADTDLVRAIMNALRLEIRAGNGNVQQVLGAPGR